uniref:RING-type domain-containing protein n=1 Tax=Clastoptera arizonana TaxID=38151 RepID=A0A1B6BZ14_9HEMI
MVTQVFGFLNLIISFLSLLLYIIKSVLYITLMMGEVVVNILWCFVVKFDSFVKSSITCVKIMYEDFIYFLNDLYFYVSFCVQFVTIVSENIIFLFVRIQNLFLNCVSSLTNIAHSLYVISYLIINYTLIFFKLVLESLQLLGLNIWMIFTEILPLLIFYAVRYTFVQIKLNLQKFNSNAFLISENIKNVIHNFSYESVSGLVIGTLILYIIYRKCSYSSFKYYIIMPLVSTLVYCFCIVSDTVIKIYRLKLHNLENNFICAIFLKTINSLRYQNWIYKNCENHTINNFEERCVICLDSKRDVILLPCRHFCMCSPCSEKFDNNNCPICRQIFNEKLQVFY